MAEIKEELPS